MALVKSRDDASGPEIAPVTRKTIVRDVLPVLPFEPNTAVRKQAVYDQVCRRLRRSLPFLL